MELEKQNINTVEYWNKRFESINGITDWELCNGCNQSENFMKNMIDNLPVKNLNEIKKSKILDVGCALGDGTNYLAKRLKNKKVIGYDFSSNAIEIAKMKYPDITFINELIKDEIYDYVLLNNVLQCVDDYNDYIKKMLSITKKVVVIMVPFGTFGTTVEHFNTFQLKSFPKEIDKFLKRKVITINTENWAFKQIIVRYERIE